MKILRLELKNFKPFRDLVLPADGYLPDGLIIIKGANSTGKSSIVEAILWALWGSDAVKPLTNDELVRFNSVSTQVLLIFEVRCEELQRICPCPASALSMGPLHQCTDYHNVPVPWPALYLS